MARKARPRKVKKPAAKRNAAKARRTRKAVRKARVPAKRGGRKYRATKARASKTRAVKEKKPRAKDQCCKDIDLGKWHLKKVKWRRKPFYVVRYGTFFHIPLGIGKAMTDGMSAVTKKYHTAYPELWLSKDTGMFSAKMMFAVDRASTSDPEIEELTGTFVSRGFQGPYSQIGNFVRVFREQVMQKYGKKPMELYFWYANCPKCAKKQGGPKTVIFGRI